MITTPKTLRDQACTIRDQITASLHNEFNPGTIKVAQKRLEGVLDLLQEAEDLESKVLYNGDVYKTILAHIRSEYMHQGTVLVWQDGVAKLLRSCGLEEDAEELVDQFISNGVLKRFTELTCAGCLSRRGTWTDEGLQRLRDDEEGGMSCEGCMEEGEETWRLMS